MVRLIIAPCQLIKHIPAGRGGRGTARRDQRGGAEKRCGGTDPQQPFDHITTAIPAPDDAADCLIKIGVRWNVVEGFKGFGLIAVFGVVDD